MAFRLLRSRAMSPCNMESCGHVPRADDRGVDAFGALLRWLHRLLNPPQATVIPHPATMSGGRRRRVRDRVPI